MDIMHLCVEKCVKSVGSLKFYSYNDISYWLFDAMSIWGLMQFILKNK